MVDTPGEATGQPGPPPPPTETAVPDGRVSRIRPRELAGALLAALVLSCIALGVWRAVALGADGLAAGTFILAAATLLSSGVIAFNRWQLRPGYAVLALLLAVLLTGLVGRWGQRYFANQPVDVTSQINWPADPDTTSTRATARLAVPKHLNSLDISVILVNRYPDAGDCSGSTFNVLRLGDVRPAKGPAGSDVSTRTGSGGTVTVSIPTQAKQIDLVLTVVPALNCQVTPYIQSAKFHNIEK